MGLFEKLKFQIDTAESKIKKSHIKNLFIVALADDRIENDEFDFILRVGDSMYLERSVILHIHSNLDDVPFMVPLNERQKLYQMYDLVSIALIDGDLNDMEILACKNIFIQFGYKPIIFEILLETIVDAIQQHLLKEAVIHSFIHKYLN